MDQGKRNENWKNYKLWKFNDSKIYDVIRKMCVWYKYIHNMLKVNLSPDKYYSFPYSFVYKKVAFQIAFGSFRKCIKNRVMPANLH